MNFNDNLQTRLKNECVVCGRQGRGQGELPLEPSISSMIPRHELLRNDNYRLELIPYADELYCHECLDEKLDAIDLKHNPNIEFKVSMRASEVFALVRLLQGSTTESSEVSGHDVASARDRMVRELSVKLGEHSNFYTQCANVEHCGRKVVRKRMAWEGEATAQVEYPNAATETVDKEHPASTGRSVYLFCSPECDVMFASRKKLQHEREAAEEKAKKDAAAERARARAKASAQAKKVSPMKALLEAAFEEARKNPSEIADLKQFCAEQGIDYEKYAAMLDKK